MSLASLVAHISHADRGARVSRFVWLSRRCVPRHAIEIRVYVWRTRVTAVLATWLRGHECFAAYCSWFSGTVANNNTDLNNLILYDMIMSIYTMYYDDFNIKFIFSDTTWNDHTKRMDIAIYMATGKLGQSLYEIPRCVKAYLLLISNQ